MSTSKSIIDETYINVHLKGGNLHSELLHIEASFNKGQFKGQSIPLRCQWFNITKDKDFVEIEDVSGQFYQPCILDIDTKIMVQAIPILDFDYNGMPLMAETNFLQADSKIFDLVNQAFNEGEMQLNCKLENIQAQDNQSFNDLNLPSICTLIANENGLILKTDQNKTIVNIDKYELKIIKKNNNQIEIFNQNIKLLAAVTNNIVRDAIFQFSKTLKSKKTHLSDTAQLYVILSDQEQKIAQKDNEISSLLDFKQKLTKNLSELQQQYNLNIKKMEQIDKQLAQQSQVIINKDKEILNLKQQIDKLDGKTQIYIQEIKVLKSQVILLENTNKKYQHEIEELKKNQNQNQDEIREMFYKEKLESLKQQNDKCIKENQQWQLINDQLMKEIKKLESNSTFYIEEKELIQNELNSLKKKYESLLQEMELNQKKEKSEISSESDVQSNKQSEIIICNPIVQNNNVSLEEIKRLKTTINNLEATIKNLKCDYEQDMLKLTNKHFLKSNTSQEIQVLQKLANSLAESLTDKEQALQTQRNINRELLNKISEFTK
ncbi:unnamed protein product (macronuclear) [Paramecium tetraurelia]|uniref:C2 NT-type domain-containing protein n=1 Tax=Paramecium tetraurelia TaxID=5888 RepID=A0E0A9_PARTE|nr:uncharacterized protein GSPATT00021894001 [Paramecium tetraurelia]CAK88726.1 unnamed protein product [Paramecium tetraurelia]|eukprot:XP_001456123.1 hypothetical protein (macronuclear) [Paramecium tetraurelia strain d4-2]